MIPVKQTVVLAWLAGAALVGSLPGGRAMAQTDAGKREIRRLNVDSATRTSRAVVAPHAPLVHTAQLLPIDSSGQIVAAGRIAGQTAQVLDNLAELLADGSSDSQRIVKLNVYVARTGDAEVVRRVLTERTKVGSEPAVSFVTTRLPHPDALVAIDAVAVGSGDSTAQPQVVLHRSPRLPAAPRHTHVAILPAGRRIYVSGQAEKGELGEATRLTLASLRRTLEFLGQTDADIVQCKSFIKPMADVARAEAEFAAFFGDRPIPPLVFVEWESTLPIEIELVARATDWPADSAPANRPPIEFLTPPGMTASPIYSRAARVNSPHTIFTAGLVSRTPGNGAAQVQDLFEQLTAITAATGSDLRHLAKATYYVADDDASRQLNELRPRYYDPKRPPAASKAQVTGIGFADRSITLDMIAVERD